MAKHLPKNKSTVAVPPIVSAETSSHGVSATTVSAVAPPLYHWYFFFGLVVLGFLLYVNTLQHGFVLDDPLSISLNTYVQKGWGGIVDILTTNYRAGVEGANSSGSVYRPLSLIMFAIEWSISPNSPFIGHFMNVLLYALTGGVVYLVFLQLLGKKNVWVAFAVALLFVAHPIHTETVANIKSRDEILCLLLFLCSLWAYLSYLTNNKKTYLLLAMGAYFLSLLSKENAITMLPVFALLHYHRHAQMRTTLVQLGISLLPAILFLAMRQYALTHSVGITTIDKMDNPIIAANNLSTQWATGVFVLGKYVQVLLFPYPLICDYSFNQLPLQTWASPLVWVSLVLMLALLGAAIVLFLRRRDVLGWLLLGFLLSLTLYSQIVLVIGTLFGERLAYLPSFWFCGALVVALFGVARQFNSAENKIPYLPLGLIGIVALVFSGMTIVRNPAWKNNLTLFLTDSPKAPNSLRLHDHLGTETYKYFVQHQTELSPTQTDSLFSIIITQAEKALAIDQTPTAYLNVGNVRYAQKNYPAAAEQYEKALAVLSGFAIAHQNLAATYREWGSLEGQQNKNPVKAAELLQKSIEHNPNDASTYNFLGVAMGMQNKNQEAAENFDKAISLDPNNNSFVQNALIAHRILGNTAKVQELEAKLQGVQ